MLKLELAPEERTALQKTAERSLRDLRLEMPDFEDLEALQGAGSREFERVLRDREIFITSLLTRLRA